jgi:hypothetical protein
MVYLNLHEAYVQEVVGLTQILGDHDFFDFFCNRMDFKTDCGADSKITIGDTTVHHSLVFSKCKLNVDLTVFVIPCKSNMGIIDLQCLQALSLMKWIFIQISITHGNILI